MIQLLATIPVIEQTHLFDISAIGTQQILDIRLRIPKLVKIANLKDRL